MKRLAAALTFALVFPALALAQATPTLRGTVTTRDDGLPLPGATVTIASLNLSAVTDQAGHYAIEVPAQAAGQTVEVKVSAAGLTPRTVPVKLTGTVTRDFALALGFQEEITVGSRAAGAEAEKAVPVDILTSKQIEATGMSETMQVIQALAPSFNFPRPSITDGTDSVRPATLRSLGPDQVLVLINGKRRHTSALVHVNGSVGRGSTGVDLNAIPVSAIERIEVLRDGAAAQYGSDAIAGVINIVLKSGVTPLTLAAKGGSTTHSDGGLGDGAANYGFKVGRGALLLSAEYRDRGATNRAAADPRDQIVAGDAGNNAVPEPNHHWGDAEEKDAMSFADLHVPVGASETTFIYGFGGFSHRSGSHGGFYRRGIDARNWPQIYPLGYLPLIEPKINDASGTFGVQGTRSGWFWDVSGQYGHNSFRFDVTDSLNVSLGPTIPPNQTSFYAGTLDFNQTLFDAAARREFDIGLKGPLNVALGAEYRRENYQIHAGEPASYADGGQRDRAGNRAPIGAQVFPGFRPSNEVDANRDNVAGYLDLEGDVVSRLRLGAAARYEHYNDFGSTTNGKLTVRIEPVLKKVVLRGAVSNGFRAPSLGQSYFSSTATNFLNVPGQGLVPFESLTMPVGSPEAQALGAQPLKPEKSTHFSGGIVITPVEAFELTVDLYRIKIDDRVVLSGNFNQASVAALLRPFGANSGRFFTNAISTETKGVEATASYKWDLHAAGSLRLGAAYSGPLGAQGGQDPHYATKIVGTIQTPPQLAGLSATLFDRIERRRIECGQPKDNVRLSGDWSKGGWAASLRTSRYGEFCSFTLSPNDDQIYGAKWLTDLEAAWSHKRFTFRAGAQNIFDVFPDKNIPVNSFNGIQVYPGHSPFGFNGRFLYARVTVKF